LHIGSPGRPCEIKAKLLLLKTTKWLKANSPGLQSGVKAIREYSPELLTHLEYNPLLPAKYMKFIERKYRQVVFRSMEPFPDN
jgi:hypothetical protein